MNLPTREEIERVERHLRSFSDPLERAEQIMLDRLKAGEWTEFDRRFCEHELLEMDLMNEGMDYQEAHLRVLELQGIRYERGYEAYLYHPIVINDPELTEWFNREARELSARLADEG